MTNNVSVPRAALSPVSVAGSDWSVSGYQSGSGLYGSGGAPPRSGSIANGGVGGGPGGTNGNGPPSSGGEGREGRTVSPPESIARSSDGAGLYAQSDTSSLRGIIQEEEVAAHHSALKKLLQPYLSQQGNGRPNKARDKLLRLSVIQFQELSTDVYDELQRREANAISTGEKPPHLLPKEKFHPKRNQARQKLSTLAMERFRDLATDVYYELERRFPQFGDGSGSPTASLMSMNGFPTPGRVGSPGPGRVGSPGPGMMPPGRVGSPGPGRVGSPGPGMMPPGRVGSPGPGRVGSPGPGGIRSGPLPGGYAPYGGGPGGGVGGPPRMGSPGMPRNGPGGGSMSSPQGNFGRPLPKTYQSGNVVPNKSIMVEDDDEGPDNDLDHDGAFGLDDRPGNRNTGPGAPGMMKRDSNKSVGSSRNGIGPSHEVDKKIFLEYKNKVEMLKGKVSALEGTLDDRNREISDLKNGAWQRENNLSYELEGKLTDAQDLNKNLQDEISRLKADKEASEQREMGGGGDRRYGELLQEHEQLKAELKEQEEVTEEVRREAMEFLNQMKSISQRTDNFYEKEEKMHADLQKLQDEVKEWKTRYARTKATLRNLRTSSVGLAMQSPTTLIAKEGGLSDPNGLIKDIHVTKFQISIDELLRTARGADCTQTLDYVNGVVMATRAITENVGDSPNDNRAKLKVRVSATANNLTTAAINHATSQGLSPVSLVDAAASHLTASIVELIKAVKIRPITQEEVEDDEEDLILSPESPRPRHGGPPGISPQTNGSQFGGNPHQYGDQQQNGNLHQRNSAQIENNRMSGESIYSPPASPSGSYQEQGRNGSTDGRGGGAWGDVAPPLVGVGSPPGAPTFGLRATENNVEELMVFLETQTEGIVERIQNLLQSIKADEDIQTLRRHITDITAVVDKVVKNTEAAMSQSGNEKLRERGDWIVANLARCTGKMAALKEEGGSVDGPAGKEFKGRLAALAFDLARETKDLVRTVEEIDTEARRPLGSVGADELR